MKKPSPVHRETVCSVCGLDWDRHTKKTADECIELLKADLSREKQRTAPLPHPIPAPYPVPYPVAPWPGPYRPWTQPQPWINPGPRWISQPTITAGTSGISVSGTTNYLPRAH